MPTLNWIGKDAVVNHHKHVPFRLLKPIDKLSVGDDSSNLLVQGDNFEALKATWGNCSPENVIHTSVNSARVFLETADLHKPLPSSFGADAIDR